VASIAGKSASIHRRIFRKHTTGVSACAAGRYIVPQDTWGIVLAPTFSFAHEVDKVTRYCVL
jgi:hypothetical protein